MKRAYNSPKEMILFIEQARKDGTLFSLTGDSTLARRMAPAVRIQKTDRAVTRDCYAAHMWDWCGGATPRRRGAQ